MKSTYLIAFFILFAAVNKASAQYEGREFIRGAGHLNFSNHKNSTVETSVSSGNLDISLSKGRFVTGNKATGFSLHGGIGLSHMNDEAASLFPWRDKANGISGFTAGVGKFWQFYKHINENWGIYGEPSVGFDFSFSRAFSQEVSDAYLRQEKYQYALALNLRAGAYYKLSEKWWLNASLGFSNPVSLSLENRKNNILTAVDHRLNSTIKTNTINYQLTPALTLPSVGLGLTYFIR